jgi:hypothetical protein
VFVVENSWLYPKTGGHGLNERLWSNLGMNCLKKTVNGQERLVLTWSFLEISVYDQSEQMLLKQVAILKNA